MLSGHLVRAHFILVGGSLMCSAAAPSATAQTTTATLPQRLMAPRRFASSSQRATPTCPEAPVGVPEAFENHIKLMFDLQVLAARHPAGQGHCRSHRLRRRYTESLEFRRKQDIERKAFN